MEAKPNQSGSLEICDHCLESFDISSNGLTHKLNEVEHMFCSNQCKSEAESIRYDYDEGFEERLFDIRLGY